MQYVRNFSPPVQLVRSRNSVGVGVCTGVLFEIENEDTQVGDTTAKTIAVRTMAKEYCIFGFRLAIV